MKTFAATLTAVLSLLTITSAAPTHQRRGTPGGVYMCTGENWTGNCTYITSELNTCTPLPEGYAKNLGSFGPDAGAYCRVTYTAASCTTHGDAFIQTPGAANLHHFDDPATGTVVDAGASITSFLCQHCDECT